MDKFESLEKFLCKQLEDLEQNVTSKGITTQELDQIDKIIHALKSLVTYKAMKESEEYSNPEHGFSGYHGRSYTNYNHGQSYEDGYSRGYAEGQRQAHDTMNHNYPAMPYPKNW